MNQIDAIPNGLAHRLRTGCLPVTGKDGLSYDLRSIRPSDAKSLMRGYAAMSAESRWFRMLSGVPRLPMSMAVQFCDPDPAQEFCVVIERPDMLGGDLLGGARVADLGPGRDAEFAVSLRPEASGNGLARQALEAAVTVAREAGCRGIYGLVSTRNQPMLALAERMGLRLRRSLSERGLVVAATAF